MTLKNICVYCGSNPGARPDYLEQARVLARELVKRDLGLVYGGSIVGIMGVIANEVPAGSPHSRKYRVFWRLLGAMARTMPGYAASILGVVPRPTSKE